MWPRLGLQRWANLGRQKEVQKEGAKEKPPVLRGGENRRAVSSRDYMLEMR